MTKPGPPPFSVEFWQDENGREPVREWLKEELTPELRLAAGEAMNLVLQHRGVEVCASGWGRHVATGIFEFRVARNPREITGRQRKRRPGETPGRILLRFFCHAHGAKTILLLAAYDKAEDPSKLRQQTEIALAKTRLVAWRLARKE